jgi:predicted  nucleic acid-binding Zn-ribbon protein
LDKVIEELERLSRSFKQIEMEWDAVQDRVSKVLRRLARERQAEEAAESTGGEGQAGEKTPLTTLTTPPDRMARIRAQLGARKGGE